MKHCKPGAFDIGAQVLMKDFNRKKRKGGKFDTKWLGPFQVKKNLGKGLYALTGVHSTLRINRVHGIHLKPYFINPQSSFENSCITDDDPPQPELSSPSSQLHQPSPSPQSNQSFLESHHSSSELGCHSSFSPTTFFPEFKSGDLSPMNPICHSRPTKIPHEDNQLHETSQQQLVNLSLVPSHMQQVSQS